MAARRSEPAPALAGDKCCLCGACLSVCPLGAVEISVKEDSVKVTDKCTGCGLCARVCPALATLSEPLEPKATYTARTRLSDVAKVCQDGGVVSSLLIWALETGYAKAAIVGGVSSGEPLLPEPRIVTSREGVLESAGSRYTPSPNLSLLKEASRSFGKGEVILVGLPCQMKAFRNIERARLVKYSSPIGLLIGLFCMESFPYASFTREVLGGLLGVSASDVARVNIKHGALIVRLSSGEERRVKVSKLKPFMRGSCRHCTDMTSEYADLSVGSIGSELGWSTVIVRTEKGEAVLREAIEAGYIEAKPLPESSWELVRRLSERKRRRAR